LRIRRWGEWPLTARLVTAFVLVTILTVLIVAAVSSAYLRAQLLSDLQQRDLYRAEATARALDAYLAGLSGRLKETASLPLVVALASQPEAGRGNADVEIALVRLTADNGYEAVVITDRSGKAVAASAPRLLGVSFESNPVFIWAIGGLTTIDGPVYDPGDGQVYIYFSVPVGPAAAPFGTVIGRVTLDAIDAMVKADSGFAGHGEFGVLWDEYGIRLSQPSDTGLRFRPLAPLPQNVADRLIAIARFGPGTREIIEAVSAWPGVMERSQSLLRNRRADPNVEVSPPGSGPLQVSIAPLEKKRWFYGIAAPETHINNAVAELWRLALVAILCAAVVAAVLAMVIARSIGRTMAEVAMALAERPVQPPVSAVTEDHLASPEQEEAPPVQSAEPSRAPVSEAVSRQTAGTETAAAEGTSEARPAGEASIPEMVRSEPPSQPAAQPSETAGVAGSGIPAVTTPAVELLSVPEVSRAPVIAPAPVKMELVGVAEPLRLESPAVNAEEAEQESAMSQQPQGVSTAEPPAEPSPQGEEELPGAPKEVSESPGPERPGWGIPLARPPMGPLA